MRMNKLFGILLMCVAVAQCSDQPRTLEQWRIESEGSAELTPLYVQRIFAALCQVPTRPEQLKIMIQGRDVSHSSQTLYALGLRNDGDLTIDFIPDRPH